ncbi:hypothetical protein ACFW7K_08415 [Streptomyces sp. NPDC058735]|uniref:hypothetical protein n=1 Tax=Streptomyces sp. NPDC058735 TaxID=3346616 RepID=UPI0036BF7BCA
MLTADPRLSSGPVADELARRIPGPRPYEKSYDKQEREQVVLAAQRQFRSALLRIRENTHLLESWRAGELVEGSREWKIGRILDHLARTGEVPTKITARGHHAVKNRVLLGGSGAEATWGRLFLSRSELTALAVLLTDRFGWNLSVYDCLPAPTRAPSAGETASVTYQLQIEKRRKGRGHWFSTENITDSGADSPGRLITQALEATAHGRALAARLDPGIRLLMVARMHYPRGLRPENPPARERRRPAPSRAPAPRQMSVQRDFIRFPLKVATSTPASKMPRSFLAVVHQVL